MVPNTLPGLLQRRSFLRFAALGGSAVLGDLLGACGGGGAAAATASAPSASAAAASTSASAPLTPSPPPASSSGTPVGGVGQSTPVGELSSGPAVPPTPARAPVTPPTPSSGTPVVGAGQVAGAVVRFFAGSTSVEVTTDQDNSAVRDFLSMLPLTLKLEEFAGREKIGYLPRRLAYSGSPGSDPKDGDLIYYVPWGNIGFYYNAAGIGYSDQTIHLGTYHASLGQLGRLAGQAVTVEVAR